MRSAVLVVVVLVLNVGGCDQPRASVVTIGTVAPHSTDTPLSIREEQATPSLDSRAASDRSAPPPDLQGFPTALAPGELASVTLPDTFSEATALFTRLPAEVAGYTRSRQHDHISPERSSVGYGEDRRIAGGRAPLLRIQALDLTRGNFFPTNWTGGQVVAAMSMHGNATEAGRDGNLFWLRDETFMSTAGSSERFPVYGMAWGGVGSPWMFSVQADTHESREALLAAFVAAAEPDR